MKNKKEKVYRLSFIDFRLNNVLEEKRIVYTDKDGEYVSSMSNKWRVIRNKVGQAFYGCNCYQFPRTTKFNKNIMQKFDMVSK